MHRLDSATKTLIADSETRRAWIIYQLSLKGRSLAAVARDAEVRRQTLYNVFQHPYPRMEKYIADALDMRPQDLFPERYLANGLPARRMGRPRKVSCQDKTTTAGRRRNINKRQAA